MQLALCGSVTLLSFIKTGTSVPLLHNLSSTSPSTFLLFSRPPPHYSSNQPIPLPPPTPLPPTLAPPLRAATYSLRARQLRASWPLEASGVAGPAMHSLVISGNAPVLLSEFILLLSSEWSYGSSSLCLVMWKVWIKFIHKSKCLEVWYINDMIVSQ